MDAPPGSPVPSTQWHEGWLVSPVFLQHAQAGSAGAGWPWWQPLGEGSFWGRPSHQHLCHLLQVPRGLLEDALLSLGHRHLSVPARLSLLWLTDICP